MDELGVKRLSSKAHIISDEKCGGIIMSHFRGEDSFHVKFNNPIYNLIERVYFLNSEYNFYD